MVLYILVMENQEEVWDKISDPWKKYRKNSPEEVVNFLKNKKGKILDLGCGHGRNLIDLKGEFYCVDFSIEQIKKVKKRAEEMGIKIKPIKSSISKLPFKNNSFDYAIFIATLHCIETKEKREKAVKELYRTLKPSAEAMISVWDKNQKKLKDKPKEAIMPWKHDGKEYQRYYYFYDCYEVFI